MSSVSNISGISANLRKVSEKFSAEIIKKINSKRTLDIQDFANEVYEISQKFKKNNQVDSLYKNFKHLIDFLVNKKQENLAEVFYSILIKFNKNNPKNFETLATNALALAKRTNDPVHTMARAADLVDLYNKTDNGGQNHIKYLRIEHKALKDICRNYNNPELKKRYRTITRDLKPLENYELMLCRVKLNIAKYDYKNGLVDAKNELNLAKKILEKYKTNKKYDNIVIDLQNELADIECKLNNAG